MSRTYAPALRVGLSLCLLVTPALAQTSAMVADLSTKGSLLVLPKVELRWNASGTELLQDTFVTLTNDGDFPITAKLYYLHGDKPAAAGGLGPNERAHPGCRAIDMSIRLTNHEPYYWSLANPTEAVTSNGKPRKFTDLDFDTTPAKNQPGRPDPLGSGERVLRGAVIIYAADSRLNPVRLNDLTARVTVFNYAQGSAYEYNAYAFRNTKVPNLAQIPLGPGNELYFGTHANAYEAAPDKLMLDFFSDRATFMTAELKTELTLWPLRSDLTGATPPPVTLVDFQVYNQNEVPFTWQQTYCIECWNSTFLSNIRPDVFLISSLQTERGMTFIDGKKNFWCDDFGMQGATTSVATPLLGVATEYFDFGSATKFAASAVVGTGTEDSILVVSPALPGGGELKTDGRGGRAAVRLSASK